MKITCFVVLCFAGIILHAAAKSAHYGIKGSIDVLLYSKDILENCPLSGKKNCTFTCKYPEEGADTNRNMITYVSAKDTLAGSNVTVTANPSNLGGDKVVIELIAPAGQGVNFQIQIYGRQLAKTTT